MARPGLNAKQQFGAYRLVALAALKPYARNARTHPDSQIEQIVRSIREFGFTNPLLVDESNEIIAGHGRLDAAKRLEMAKIPCIVLKGLTSAQKRALVLADNRIAVNAGWDLELLSGEIKALSGEGFDLELTGFSLSELDRLLAPTGLTDPDDVPDAPVNPVAKLGDVWVLGRHRLVCGDCTEIDVVDKALDGVKPHLMVTDPPYGVEYDANWRNDAAQAGYSSMGRGAPGGRATGKVENDDKADWREAWALFPGEVAYVWHAGTKAHLVADSLLATHFVIRAQIIWAKSNMVISRGHYHPQHEPLFYAVRGTGHWHGDRKQTTLWMIDKPQKSETGHSTQKPVECMRRPIENNSAPGQAVYEPFSGSGTTIIAAEMTARSCHAIELNPVYVDVAVERWQNFTGEKAVRA